MLDENIPESFKTRIQRNWKSINVPSEGAFYEGKLPNGAIQISQMTGREEAVFNNGGLDNIDKIEAVMHECVRLPEDFRYSIEGINFSGMGGLLASDRAAILMAIRIASHGGNYTVNWRCVNCDTPNKGKIDLAHLGMLTPSDIAATFKSEERGEVGNEPYPVKLEGIDKTVYVRFLRGQDDVEIRRRVKQLQNEVTALDPVATIRRAIQIVKVDGIPEWLQVPPQVRETWIRQNIDWSNGLRIDNAHNRRSTGPVSISEQKCRACGTPQNIPVEYNSEFFRPTDL